MPPKAGVRNGKVFTSIGPSKAHRQAQGQGSEGCGSLKEQVRIADLSLNSSHSTDAYD